MRIAKMPIYKFLMKKCIMNFDIVGLRSIIIDNGLNPVDINGFIFSNTGINIASILKIIDDNGLVKNDTSLEYIVYHRFKGFHFLYKCGCYKNYITDLQSKFFEFCFKYCVNDDEFHRWQRVIAGMGYQDPEFLNNLSLYFNGEEFTELFYDTLWNSKKVSENIPDYLKNHYTNEELNIDKIYSTYDYKKLPEMEQTKFQLFRFLKSYLTRKDLQRCVTIEKDGSKVNVEFYNLDEYFFKKVFYNISVQTNLKVLYNEELQNMLKQYFSDAQVYLFLDAPEICSALDQLDIPVDDIDKYVDYNYGKVIPNSNLIQSLIDNNLIPYLYELTSMYYNKDNINKLHLKEIDSEVLLYISKMYIKYNDELKELPLSFLEDLKYIYLPLDKVKSFGELLDYICYQIYQTNSPELKAQGPTLLSDILENSDMNDYKAIVDRIVAIFNNDDMPEIGKRFLLFKLTHPQFEEDDFSQNRCISPTLKNINPQRRFELIVNDLVRITLGCNNVNMKQYLENLYEGFCLYTAVGNNEITINDLTENYKEVLNRFLRQLCALHNSSIENKELYYELTGNIEADFNHLVSYFKPNYNSSILDKIVRMYGLLSNFRHFNEAIEYTNSRIKAADQRGRQFANKPLSLEPGDMIKGIEDIKFLYDILQNGSLCREFLGASMGSDATPMDTDLSMIMRRGLSLTACINETKAKGYGPIWFVIKKGKFPITRDQARMDSKVITSGPECFVTLEEGHMGIRTGFSTSDIDYIMIDASKVSIEEVGFTIALNGIYIPLVDNKTGKVLFTPREYDEIRAKMEGLSYYDNNDFKVSSNLYVAYDYDNQLLINDANNKRKIINEFIKKVVKEEFNLSLIPKLSADISLGHVQLIDTGSTGRGTNVDIESDFDFIMRIDEAMDPIEISKAICKHLGINYDLAESEGMIMKNGNLRLSNIHLPNIDTPLKIDITYLSKAQKVVYTTDMAINDRLETIKKYYPDKYETVLDNIIYAKQFLKANGAYKPSHSPESQGGLGGVGIENWVLQNGGSFYDACMSFYKVADNNGKPLPFGEFKKRYKIYDFGQNFYNGKHDEFISDNMDAQGYVNMYKAIKTYLHGYSRNNLNSELENPKRR